MRSILTTIALLLSVSFTSGSASAQAIGLAAHDQSFLEQAVRRSGVMNNAHQLALQAHAVAIAEVVKAANVLTGIRTRMKTATNYLSSGLTFKTEENTTTLVAATMALFPAERTLAKKQAILETAAENLAVKVDFKIAADEAIVNLAEFFISEAIEAGNERTAAMQKEKVAVELALKNEIRAFNALAALLHEICNNGTREGSRGTCEGIHAETTVVAEAALRNRFKNKNN